MPEAKYCTSQLLNQFSFICGFKISGSILVADSVISGLLFAVFRITDLNWKSIRKIKDHREDGFTTATFRHYAILFTV